MKKSCFHRFVYNVSYQTFLPHGISSKIASAILQLHGIACATIGGHACLATYGIANMCLCTCSHLPHMQSWTGKSQPKWSSASFSNHPSFQDVITKRNNIWTQAAQANQDNIVEEERQKGKPKKRKVEGAPEVIEVPVGDTTIACLLQGKRPTKSDLVVPLEEDQLKPIFLLLHQDWEKECLKHRKAYNKSRAQAVPGESGEPKAWTTLQVALEKRSLLFQAT